MLTPGSRFANFEILAELGRGTTGVVYKVLEVYLKRCVALKMLNLSGNNARKSQASRFLQEVRVLANLTVKPDVNIPSVYQLGEHNGCLYQAREFVDGETLERQTSDGSVDLRLGITILETIARTIHRIHQLRFVHCNLQPSNILIARDGTPKLIGFGRVGLLPGSVLAPEETAGVSLDLDLTALQRNLVWLCSSLKQRIPPCLEGLQHEGAVESALEFANALTRYLNDQSGL
jgi:serine/threonine protein kinase